MRKVLKKLLLAKFVSLLQSLSNCSSKYRSATATFAYIVFFIIESIIFVVFCF